MGQVSGTLPQLRYQVLKTDTPITEIPNSIYVVTKQLMQDQQPQNVVEALRYTPGVYSESLGNYSNGSGLDGTNSGIKQRGFSTTSFVDGLALNSGSSGETAFIDRIEAVNGPASVMYGQTNPGGMIGISLKNRRMYLYIRSPLVLAVGGVMKQQPMLVIRSQKWQYTLSCGSNWRNLRNAG
ncbi:TonB-dependent receptor plug domain-containing protein [Komagataeibacter rhaeticus]|nr:TonB-dependent receptor plug domain-containing protein [Komagataeibacter rhaeticus]